MGEPKREVSWLESFPPDIWAYFARYLPGEQILRLTMTGATFVSQRLKSPSVVKSIKLGKDFMVFKSVPRFLNDLPCLQELSISGYNNDWQRKLCLTIDSIPSGVRKLKLSGDWSDELFGAFGQSLKLKEHLPRLEALDLHRSPFTSYSWMEHCPQSLTKLVVLNWDSSVELPSSLLHFEAEGVDFPTTFVAKLPPALESFMVTFAMTGADLIVPLLPSSVHKLSLGVEAEILDEPEEFLSELPKSLIWLKLPIEIDFEENPELISLLPSTLIELDIQADLPCSVWPHLPKQLTKLTFGPQEYLQVGSLPFGALPRSITSLNMSRSYNKFFCSSPPTSNLSYFPPQLRCLNMADLQLSPETAKLFPSSLTYLMIANLCERVCEHLPKGLKTLISSEAMITPNLISLLPNSLTYLCLSVPHDYDPWFNYNTGERLDSLANHPQYSIHKMCITNSFDWNSPLPSTLTSLDLPNAKELGDSFMVHQKLPNLLCLRLDHSEHFSDLSIPLLPPCLKTLDLRSASKISGKSFQFLPRCLTYLNLDSSQSIFDSDIQHLPRNLKSANLSRSIHLTDSCISDLPPHLESLKMTDNSKITPSSLPNFPYSLRTLQNPRSAEFSSWYILSGRVAVKTSYDI